MMKVDLQQFDYRKVGKADADMWRAYYNHEFYKLFWLLTRLLKSQLGLSWFVTVRLAFYSAWAAADYRVHRGNVNNKRVLKNLTKFYKLIVRHALDSFDYNKAARLELAWWDVHRSSYKNNPELEKALAEGFAVVYKVSPAKLKQYAHYRAEAMMLPRHEGASASNQTDWQKIEELTIKSWQALYSVVNNT